jgi:ABC-type transport system involved in multi-copper enzyme maturation permease subunit
MIRVVRAELRRLVRPRTLTGMLAAAIVFAVVAGWSVFASAADVALGAEPMRRGGVSLAELAEAGGGTAAFAVGASFAGFLVFVTAIAVYAGEFSGGTFRALLLNQPGRRTLFGGKLVGFLVVVAGMVAVAEVATLGVSWLLAPGQNVATDAWFGLEGLAAAASDYATALAGVVGWSVFGATLAVIFRSAPLALGVGFAWAGPFENIVVESWSTGYRWFPGQVLGSLIRGGTVELGFGRAAITAAVYAAVAAIAMLTLVSRRDVTA